MTITLYAQPYDISATGFYFSDAETYEQKLASLKNSYGEPVEEFEIQFIDGEAIDAGLFRAVGVYQNNLGHFFEAADTWDDDEKTTVIIAAGEGGYSFNIATDSPDNFDIDIYYSTSLRELAEEFVDEGLFGEIPEHLANYIDMEAIAADLAHDYTETTIAGTRLVYRLN